MTRKTLKVHCRADGGTAGFEMRAPWPYCDTPRAYTEHVSSDAFAWLPEDVQCRRCAVLGGIGSGTHEHLMAVELLVAMLQRLWAARLEVGHRCYHPYDETLGSTAPSCTSCGALTVCHVRHVARWTEAKGDLFLVDVLGIEIRRAPNIRSYPQFELIDLDDDLWRLEL